jgi:hypothetical protein
MFSLNLIKIPAGYFAYQFAELLDIWISVADDRADILPEISLSIASKLDELILRLLNLTAVWLIIEVDFRLLNNLAPSELPFVKR